MHIYMAFWEGKGNFELMEKKAWYHLYTYNKQCLEQRNAECQVVAVENMSQWLLTIP